MMVVRSEYVKIWKETAVLLQHWFERIKPQTRQSGWPIVSTRFGQDITGVQIHGKVSQNGSPLLMRQDRFE
jgi:hypothetical protein